MYSWEQKDKNSQSFVVERKQNTFQNPDIKKSICYAFWHLTKREKKRKRSKEKKRRERKKENI